jgi:alkylated DNA nucleotide flippase Atl1
VNPDENEQVRAAGDVDAALAGLGSRPPADFALRILRHVGIPEERYDTWTELETAAGALYVANGRTAITGAVIETAVAGPDDFESRYRRRTGRTAVRSTTPFPGVRPALRTGRTGKLPVDLDGLSPLEQAVLAAVRTIPSGQLRPLGWVAREAAVAGTEEVLEALALNPMSVIIPSHRVTFDDGRPCDAGLPLGSGRALRAAEGIDPRRLDELSARGAVFLGSATTHIYCHPTCAHARRITPRHQRPFRTAGEARRAGFRACRSCRPLTT